MPALASGVAGLSRAARILHPHSPHTAPRHVQLPTPARQGPPLMAPTVLVTGASGFVGQAVVAAFGAAGWAVHASTRQPQRGWPAGVAGFQVDADAPDSGWQAALQGVDIVDVARGCPIVA